MCEEALILTPQLKAKHVLITENVEPIHGVVTRMMASHRTHLLSTTRLAILQSKFAKFKCFFSANDGSISKKFSLLEITLLIIRV